jgi:hypothetical protein
MKQEQKQGQKISNLPCLLCLKYDSRFISLKGEDNEISNIQKRKNELTLE